MNATCFRFSLLFLLILSVLFSCNTNRDGKFVTPTAQFLNCGFEQKSKTNLPANWILAPTVGYVATLVTDIKNSGTYSLKIEGKPIDDGSNINIKQKLAIDYQQAKRIRVSAYIKTEKLKGNVVLWYTIEDERKKEIDFGSSESSGVMATGTKDWQKYAIDIIVSKAAKNLVFGAYMRGAGTVWFDDFAIETYEGAVNEPTPEVVKFNKEFIDIVKQNSLYKDTVNWKLLDDDLALMAKGLKTTDDAQLLNNYVLQHLKEVGDNHSFIQYNVVAKNYVSGNITPTKPEAKLLTNQIGYISVPGYGSVNEKLGEEFASDIQTLIKNLDTQNDIKGWIVDLRTNSGGNMWPMISGLGPLLDLGNVGYFLKGESSFPWKHTANGIGIKVKNPYRVRNNNKIAVLIGKETGSSGEMTAISFIGQQNAKLFGEPSAGYITSNSMFKLSDGSNLLLATTYVADRNHKKYLERVYPDVTVKPLANQDAVLQIAKSWLEGK